VPHSQPFDSHLYERRCFSEKFSKEALQGGQDSNLQPAVLETAALPIEPPPFALKRSPGNISGHAKAWQISTTGISVRHGFAGQKAPPRDFGQAAS
jgi:hypothetical protein